MTSRFTVFLACKYSRFSLLLATNDVSPGEKCPWRNVLSGEELGGTAVLTGLSFSGRCVEKEGRTISMKLPPAPRLLNGRPSLWQNLNHTCHQTGWAANDRETVTWDQALFYFFFCFFGPRVKKNNAWYIYLTSRRPPPNLHSLTSPLTCHIISQSAFTRRESNFGGNVQMVLPINIFKCFFLCVFVLTWSCRTFI